MTRFFVPLLLLPLALDCQSEDSANGSDGASTKMPSPVGVPSTQGPQPEATVPPGNTGPASTSSGNPSSPGSGGSGNTSDFFGDSRCSPDFLLCEDFESGQLDTDLWQTQGPAPTIEDTRAARGRYSAHFHTEGNGLSLIRQAATFPAPGNRYYARAFVSFSAMPTAPMWAHWTISGAEGSGDTSEIRIGGQWDGNSNRFGVGTDGGPTGDWTNLDRDPSGNPQAVPEGEWVCLEWMNDGAANESRFWWNDVEHPSLHTSLTEHGGNSVDYVLPTFESMWFGWWLYQANPDPPAYDVWMDELVVDDEPIGCTR